MPNKLICNDKQTLQEGEKISKTANEFLFAIINNTTRRRREKMRQNVNTFICN
jgi:hypothetical protein